MHRPPLEYLLCTAAGSAETEGQCGFICDSWCDSWPVGQCPVGLKGLLVLGKGSGLLSWASPTEVLVNVVSLL